MSRARPLVARVFALALAAASPGLAAAAPPASAAAFDAAVAQFDARGRDHGDQSGAQAEFDRLGRLLPAGDRVRALRLQALRCGVGMFDDPARTADAAQAMVAQARAVGDADAEVRLHYCLGDALDLLRREQAAIAEYGRGIELARRAGLPRLLGEGLELRAASYSVLGEQATALLDLMQAQRVYERARLTGPADRNTLGLGIAYRRMGEYDQALAYLRRAELSGHRHSDRQVVFTSLLQQGYLHYDRDDVPASLVALQQALELAEREGFKRDTALARIALAASHVHAGEHARALQLVGQAERELEALHDRSGVDALLRIRRGEALAGLGRHREALADFARARADLVESENLRYRILLYRARAASLEAVGRPAEALAEYKQLLQAEVALDRITQGQQETLMRHQFDVGRREHEHRQLAAQKALRDEQVQAGLRARRWQLAAIGSSVVLVLLLAGLGLRQLRRGRRLHALAMTDPLTGAANRRSLERFATDAIASERADMKPVSVIALDVDHFKRINDRYGHGVGDDVLRRVADACQRELRKCDLLGRTGGEEFVAVLPGTPLAAAQRVAERLLVGIRGLDLDGAAQDLRITVSLGVAEFRAKDRDFRHLLHRADAALYAAKQNGRDRIECDDGRVAVPAAGEGSAAVAPTGSAMAPLPARA